jgi:hypothetical protein
MLAARCGTLDCHGNVRGNLRLYGYGGLRLGGGSPDDGDIRPEEVRANHEAVIALEPEVMRAVVLERGAAPERLTLVRKARGEEDHRGGAPIVRGDDADRCLLSWLASSVDPAACTAAAPPRDAGR